VERFSQALVTLARKCGNVVWDLESDKELGRGSRQPETMFGHRPLPETWDLGMPMAQKRIARIPSFNPSPISKCVLISCLTRIEVSPVPDFKMLKIP